MTCICGTTLQELGIPACNVLMASVRRLLFTDTPDLHIENGDAILTDELFNDYILAQQGLSTNYFFGQTSPELYLTPTIENFEATKEDSVKETFNSGASLFVREGLWTFQFVIPASPFATGIAWKRLRCARNLHVYLIDANGRVWGQKDSLTDPVPNIYPLKILDGSFDVKAEFTTDSTIQKWIITFQLDPSVKDEMLVGLGQTSAWLTHTPPIAVLLQNLTTPVAGSSDISVVVVTHFQSDGNPPQTLSAYNTPLYGLTNANFKVYINGTLQTITSNEFTPGNYLLTWTTALASGDVLEVEFVPNGLPYKAYNKLTFNIP